MVDGTPANSENWLLARCLRHLARGRPETRAVIAFSDPTPPLGHRGTIYQASNALAYGTSARRRFYRDPAGRLRHPRQRGQNIILTEAAARGWIPEWRCGKHRYLFLLGPPADRADARQRLRVTLTPYPAAVPPPTVMQRLAAAGGWGLPYPAWAGRAVQPLHGVATEARTLLGRPPGHPTGR